MLLSSSGTRTTLPPHTRDAAPIKSKVALQLTAAQGIDYYSMVRTVPASLHREGHRRHRNRRMVIDTLYIVITAPRSHYIYPTSEEIMSMTDYMKAVRVGHIKAGLNHEHIKELAKLPHAGQTKVIVLTYEANKPKHSNPNLPKEA